jgi:hypothetical protein
MIEPDHKHEAQTELNKLVQIKDNLLAKAKITIVAAICIFAAGLVYNNVSWQNILNIVVYLIAAYYFFAIVGIIARIESMVQKLSTPLYVDLRVNQGIKFKKGFKSKISGLSIPNSESADVSLYFYRVVRIPHPPFPGLGVFQRGFGALIEQVSYSLEEDGDEWIAFCRPILSKPMVEVDSDDEIGHIIKHYLDRGWMEVGFMQDFDKWLALVKEKKSA